MQNKLFSDIDMNFTKQRSGDLDISYDDSAIVNSLINISSTMQGDRRMLPEFAMNSYNMLFEQMDDSNASLLAEYIWDGIEMWESRVTIKEINVHKDYAGNKYDVSVVYVTKQRPDNELTIELPYLLRGK
jgi:phage baseplate assembly protein W